MAELNIKEFTPADTARWDAFVAGNAEATFFHRAGWKDVIERAFGHRMYLLYAERNGQIEGVYPLGHIHSQLFGNALISVPFCVYGGAAAASDAARAALDTAAQELAVKLGVDYLEVRSRVPRHDDWLRKDLYVTFRKAIDPDVEKNMTNIPRKQRAMVRKGIDAGLVGELDVNIERFYEAYAHSVHALGTPVFPKSYFKYWDLMRRSCERGLKVFDYGRSKQGTGSYSFKKNWGFEPQPLYYEYFLVKAKALPNVSPTNPKYELFIKLWKKLPFSITKIIGPYIAKNLG
ncbi:MAG: peptidoglycan bridge formation protein FemAB [Gammaproteobacteria bacterium]|nr:peptidoglycan bridge formation protein FemAB [Gammaproteobacteria bacterium]